MYYPTLRALSRFCLPALALLLVGVSGVAASAATGKEYTAKRRRAHYDPKLTYATVQANPAAYIGRVLELRGQVCGTVESETGLSVMLNQAGKSALTLDVPRAETGPLEECSTPRLRVLAKVESGSSGNVVALTVLAVADENEVSVLEAEAAARAAAQQQRLAARRAARVWQPQYAASRATFPARGGYTRPPLAGGAIAEMARRYDAYLGPRVKPLFVPYCQFIAARNPRLTSEMAGMITVSLLHFADRYNVDPRLVVAMILAESGFNPNATSRVGAMGLGQLMPGTAAALGVSNPYDPVQNLDGSINYLRSRLDTFADQALPGGGYSFEQVAYALAAYNAGTNAVKKYKGIPPYRETQAYVRRVMSLYQQLCQ